MGNVVVLDENTINKIAAGEVIDRPASIVKELVENSIDAGAKNISIDIRNGGIQKIKIIDDGSGISPDDVELAFERHATSKIRKEEDIQNIKSMGFRGEALASIAAISKVTISTKKVENHTGTRLVIVAGKTSEVIEIAWDVGTTIVIEDVFANIPARYKFLKKDYIEAGYIEDNIIRLALANPNISFKYINNGKQIFNTTGNGDIKYTIFNIFGKQIMENIHDISYEYENIKVNGIIGNPNISRSTRQNEFMYVNTRFVNNKTLIAALEKGFEQKLNIGKFPFAVINVEIPPQEIDVNVHPAKLEIKFQNESKVFDAVFHAVKNKIEEYHRSISPFTSNEINTTVVENRTEEIKQDTNIIEEEKEKQTIPIYFNEDENIEIKDLIKTNKIDEDIANYDTEIKYRYIGCLFDTYILIEIKEKLYIIDQHAAHERLLYEQISSMYYNKKKETQILMMPLLLELKHKEKAYIDKNKKIFEDIGYIFEDFGDSAIKISGVPNVGYNIGYEEMFKDVLDEMVENVNTTNKDLETRFIYTLACKAAVKGNMKLTNQEHIALLDKMIELKNPFTCPHGRPTAYQISKYEIERKFKRK